MSLTPIWAEHISKLPSPVKPENLFSIALSKDFYAAQTRFVQTGEEAEALLQLAMERPVSLCGFDFEYRYCHPPVMRGKSEHYDVRSMEPLLLSLTLVEDTGEGEIFYCFVVDLTISVVLSALNRVFQLPILFVAHFAKGDLCSLWQLGLSEPKMLWDTWVCEKSLFLGQAHINYKVGDKGDVASEINAKEEVFAAEVIRYSLVATCGRYSIPMKMSAQKVQFQRSFLSHEPGTDFSHEQIEYAAEDAIAVARLYPQQVMAALRKGLLHHLIQVEMPWVVTVARMEWIGIRVDADLASRVSEECERGLPILSEKLQEYGLPNASSNPQVKAFFSNLNLLQFFAGSDGVKFDKKLLKRHINKHPAVALIIEYRQLRSLLSDGMLNPALIGSDDRYHPEHQQLGTHTGRQTSKNPNALGLPGKLRPLVIPEEGYGIGEVDLCQIEVGVTAAIYNDAVLVDLFNSGDVYSSMAQLFYSKELSEQDRVLDGAQFKKVHSEKRSIMKTATLAMIYGSGTAGLASQLGVTAIKAKQLVEKFLGLFPALALAKKRTAHCSARRGYGATVSGLRRLRGKKGKATGWEDRWLVNFPVQGSAAVAFKMAGNRLDRLYPPHGARLLLPMHDAFVFEAPLATLNEVAELTGRVLCEAVQECFPQLRPRVDINISKPQYWNKVGAEPVISEEKEESA